ncbi:MAG: GNAT family N-acetyltransferase [Myxococcales bacterium]|nr:GNAT family N-acetyltransferase [Myxococcales bacterium]MCB9669830.1 GNAT family N-acetyltransferase [Alphaproteobacteria bacterium]MCB9694570.1 GNAT family N-acetyltransferase [Alphaproteobacteria bacterium]
MSWTIREPRPDEAAEMLRYARGVFADASWFTLTELEEFTMTVDDERAFIEGVDRERGDQAWVAVDGARIVGMLTARVGRRRKIAHRLELGMSVDAGWRRQGIGRALLERCVETARAHPRVETVALEVFADNHGAIALYTSCGFVREGYRQRYARRVDGSWADDIPMVLQLT